MLGLIIGIGVLLLAGNTFVILTHKSIKSKILEKHRAENSKVNNGVEDEVSLAIPVDLVDPDENRAEVRERKLSSSGRRKLRSWQMLPRDDSEPYPGVIGQPQRAQSGVVKFFNSAKGYGFVSPDDGGADIFVQAKSIEASGMRFLTQGQRVSYKISREKDGRYEISNIEEISGE